MSVTVSRDIPQSQNVAQVFQGLASLPVPAKPVAEKPAQPEGSGVKASAQVISLLDEQQEQRRTSYDQPNNKNRQALQAYQSLANQEKREQIQQLFSVDLFA
ncbi:MULTISPECIES: hypothetical protein [Rheinheimera]|uniref:Uncharacterized protein n=1 Tax=Rheinheimera marina TaxID=1774958 RepID=A0ABV9JKQ6_9GAMM